MSDMKFNSLNDLYVRLKPALRVKKADLQRDGYGYIVKEDIWNYLKESKWDKSNRLELYQMVEDILLVEHNLLDLYIKYKLKDQPRELISDTYEDDIL